MEPTWWSVWCADGAVGAGAVVAGIDAGIVVGVVGVVVGGVVPVGVAVVGGAEVVTSDGSTAGVSAGPSTAEPGRAAPTVSATASAAADVVIAATRVNDGRSGRRVRMGGMVLRIRLRSASMSGDEWVSARYGARFTEFSEFLSG